ncbi:MAG: DUF5946 family protein [Chloroflexota bacterium]
MSDEQQKCPECGTLWPEGTTCQDYFHQLLALEWEYSLPAVHHLLVLCYHLQHPSLYSPEGLIVSQQLLVDFLERGLSTEEVRRRSRDLVDSGKRQFKITGRQGARGAHANPVRWTMTAADVVAGGHERYYENVKAWAVALYRDLRASGNLQPAGARPGPGQES